MAPYFQRLLNCSPDTIGKPTILLAAFKSRILSFSFQQNDPVELLSCWESNVADEVDIPAAIANNGNTISGDHHERPTKRQKRSTANDGSESSSAEIVTEDGKSKRSKTGKSKTTEAEVNILTTTSNGQFVVAVTGEDKGVRVLRLKSDGTLQQLSKRLDRWNQACALG